MFQSISASLNIDFFSHSRDVVLGMAAHISQQTPDTLSGLCITYLQSMQLIYAG